MSEHVGTVNNTERSGNRNDLALSNSMRKIRDVRHLDLDLIQWTRNPHTGEYVPEIFFEATSQTSKPKNTEFTRWMAKQHKAYAILVTHAWCDNENEAPVKVTIWNPEGEMIFRQTTMSWDKLEQICQMIANIYRMKK